MRKRFASVFDLAVSIPSGRLIFFRKSAGRMGSIQIVRGIEVGVGLGAVVGVAVGGKGVAGSEVAVGAMLGEEAIVGWQAPSKTLISTKMLTMTTGTDL